MAHNKTTIQAEPGQHSIQITREFDAPRELVFKATIAPELIAKWWGPRRLSTQIETLEARPGGKWRFINRDDNGHEFGFHGVFHEVVAPELTVMTFEFEGLPEIGHVTLETMRLEELPEGRTRLSAQSVFQSVADRDGMLQSGMEDGANESYDRLDEILETLKSNSTSNSMYVWQQKRRYLHLIHLPPSIVFRVA